MNLFPAPDPLERQREKREQQHRRRQYPRRVAGG